MSLNQRLIRTNDVGGGGALGGGIYSIGADYIYSGATDSVVNVGLGGANCSVGYHVHLGRYYVMVRDNSGVSNIKWSDDNFQTINNISVPSIGLDASGRFCYNPVLKRLYFGGNLYSGICPIGWIDEFGNFDYNIVNVASSSGIGKGVVGHDFTYVYLTVSTGGSSGGVRFQTHTSLVGGGGTIAQGTEIMGGTARLNNSAVDFNTGKLKARRQYGANIWYYSNSGTFDIGLTFSPNITNDSYISFANGLFFMPVANIIYYTPNADGDWFAGNTIATSAGQTALYVFYNYDLNRWETGFNDGKLYYSTDNVNWVLFKTVTTYGDNYIFTSNTE